MLSRKKLLALKVLNDHLEHDDRSQLSQEN